MLTLLLLSLCIALAYTLGSLCSAVIVCRAAKLPDPRLEGSKNPGATNVLRLAGKHYAALVLLGDFFKGLLPVWFASLLGLSFFAQSLVGLAAVLGHMYPMFFNFKGGKGVATTLGVLLGFQPLLGLLVMITWLVVAVFSRYSSLASIVSVTLAPCYALLAFHTPTAFLPLAAITVAVLYQHQDNIKRLLDGTESKLNFTLKKQQKKQNKN
jgi:acyl phosphate:glycerol-3-phosphate acyltransferase